MLGAILSVALGLGGITAVPSILMALRDRLYSVVVIDVLAIAWLFVMWRWRTLSFTIRSWNFLLIVFAVGVFFLFKVGPVSQIYMMAVPVLAALLLGLRPAILMLVVNAVTLVTVGYWFDIDLQFDRYHDQPFLRWIIITLNFTFISSVITVTCGVLLRRLEESLRKQMKISLHLQQEQKSLRHANEELRLISAAVENLNDMVMITDNNLSDQGPHLVFVNKAFERSSGYSRHEAIGNSLEMLFGANSDIHEIHRIRSAMADRHAIRSEIISYTKNADEFWLEVDIRPINNQDGHCTHYVAIERDITDRKKAELDIYRLAFFDVLTGLPNRRLLRDRMGVQLANAQRTGNYSAVLFIDLDHFKTINDARGHAVGDVLLVEVAKRLSQLLREVDTVARIGGDEFVVLVDSLDSHIELAGKLALTIAEKVRHALSQDFLINDQIYSSSCSIGVSLMPKPGQSADDLLRESDTAMYRAKTAGRNQIAFFEGAMQTEVEERLTLERDLAKALDQNELHMVMQAQVDQNGVPLGAELLMRWNNKRRGMVSPATFIPLAEESGLIVRMGDWVLLQACQILKHLQREGFTFPLSINVSPKQFRQKDFVDKVSATLAGEGVDGNHLIFEVTEGLFIDNLQETISRMDKLADLGIRFSIDDFGTGYSSLNYLKRLPLYELKIDKSFVQDIPDDANGTAIVRSILSMAKQFSLKVVAEGVETQEQANYLMANECDSMQGFLYSKPTAPDVWVEQQRAKH
ncbi:putative bifunctional diguanylate cyclase/phosphodiesterase [Undibacterium fentianense]|uniref:EAL domain-containing protein n=1 Tax=Undibacterium fentianense TaxID=2828728 RepID=A0A941E1W7_9BURK|nr:EAL domain-containing protein [Undibacterium fentianense]MBR7799732.1 EAL domain-containing protein [Undibacterium fentianense]